MDESKEKKNDVAHKTNKGEGRCQRLKQLLVPKPKSRASLNKGK